jgi:hypothetical protein
MAELKVTELEGASRVQAAQRLYVDASGEKVVAENSPDAASLLAAEGDEIDRDKAVKLGLVKPTAEEKKAAAKSDDKAEEKAK